MEKLSLSEYQRRAMTTALPNSLTVEYMLLGLCNEAGEVAGKWKKKLRDGVFDKEAFAQEIGDVLWYVACLSSVVGEDLENIGLRNLAKLKSRAERQVLRGSGDDR